MKTMLHDGGVAFPCALVATRAEQGMALLDYFAIHMSDADIHEAQREALDRHGPLTRAEARYRCAAALLQARSQL